ncbi:peptidase family M13 [Xylogone sp. PMI_703]|nr:peptidase family M13 [Xylogone sp. PMI_703]
MPSESDPLLPGAERHQENVQRRNRLGWIKRNAVIICMTGLMAGAIVVIALYFAKYRQEKDKPTDSGADVCLTPACVHASSEILYNLSPNYKELDPCEDFEELVCGGWSARHDLRPDQGDMFTGTIMSENSQILLRHILEAPYPSDSKHSSFSPAQLLTTLSSVDQQNFEKLKAGYDACMDEATLKDLGSKPLVEVVRDLLAFLPVRGGKKDVIGKKPDEHISGAFDFLARIGVTSLVAVGVGADDKDPDTIVLQVAAPYSIGLPAKDYYNDEDVVSKYEATIAEVTDLFHKNVNREGFSLFDVDDYSNVEGKTPGQVFAHDLVEFEKQLASASPDAEDQNDVTKYYNPMTLAEADALTPQIQLKKVIEGLVPHGFEPGKVIVMAPEYQKTLSHVLSNTTRSTIRSYMLWKIIQAYASDVDAEETKPYLRFRNVLQGKDPESQPERWRVCVDHVDGALGWILSRFFVEKAFSEKAKNFGDQIVSDIKEMFINKLKDTDWMEKSVADLAIEKVHKIVQKIGYPTKSPDIMNPEKLNDYYKNVSIDSKQYFQNNLNVNRFEVIKEWSALGKPTDRDQWGMTVPTVNAYYNPPGNEIVFPAGIMQFPVFDVDIPKYLSYGAFGSVSGHELSHAFDSTGRHYDQNGNFTDWWTNSTVQNFTQRADCFVKQYSDYSVEGPDGKPLHVNGKLTLGENIADAGGVAAAFAAWKKRQAESPSQDLPGLEYFTQDQLFFVSYSNWWCGKSRKETAINRIYTDPHAPKWARVLGTMANSRDFRESFKCASKEPVCELW